MAQSKYNNIVISGASSGIGAELAIQLSAKDVFLCLLGRDEKRLTEIAQKCQLKGAATSIHIVDVRDDKHMEELLLEQDDQHSFDLVIASAGVGRQYEDAEFIRLTTEINVFGVLNMVEPLLPRLKERNRGQIAVLSSLAGFRTFGRPAGYSASKAWVRLYGEALRGQYAKYGVGVSVVCPGFVKTPMVQNAPKNMSVMPVEEAAAKIVHGLKRNKGRIIFPWHQAFFIWLISTLPTGWLEKFFIKQMDQR
ncbi:MAG: SDR family NAD(P)-dependent oxidoreductase [Lentilitoribacter sp.]